MTLGITLFGVWFENSLIISSAALLVSAASFLFAASARPSIALSITRRLEEKDGKFVGDLLLIYNSGRRGTVVTHAGIRGKRMTLLSPVGEVAGISANDASVSLPFILGPGDAITLPFQADIDTGYDRLRDTRGYSVTYYAPRRPWRWRAHPCRDWKGYERFGWTIYNPFKWARSKTVRIKFSNSLR